ncbi:hypothetical protein ACFQL4_03975 [Halosimplex aquaticum]
MGGPSPLVRRPRPRRRGGRRTRADGGRDERGRGRDAPSTSEDRLARWLEAAVDRPTAALITLAWRRAARAPLKLMYAAYPLFFGTGAFVEILQTGQIPVYLPYGLLVFLAWAGGVVFTLNPLGDQGSVLATTLLSEVTGHRFVGAHVLAGLLVVVPVGTALVAVTAVLSPLDARSAAILTGLAPVSMVVAAALSVGIGMAFLASRPRTSPARWRPSSPARGRSSSSASTSS